MRRGSEFFSGGRGDEIPAEGRAGIDFVVLNVEVTQEALVSGELIVWEFGGDEIAGGVFGEVALDVWEDGAEDGGEVDE